MSKVAGTSWLFVPENAVGGLGFSRDWTSPSLGVLEYRLTLKEFDRIHNILKKNVF